jgi:hypothetical protein
MIGMFVQSLTDNHAECQVNLLILSPPLPFHYLPAAQLLLQGIVCARVRFFCDRIPLD